MLLECRVDESSNASEDVRGRGILLSCNGGEGQPVNVRRCGTTPLPMLKGVLIDSWLAGEM